MLTVAGMKSDHELAMLMKYMVPMWNLGSSVYTLILPVPIPYLSCHKGSVSNPGSSVILTKHSPVEVVTTTSKLSLLSSMNFVYLT